MNPLMLKRWNPYVVGLLIGVLSWATFLTMDKALGTSTTMVHLSGLATRAVAPEHFAANAYYAKEITPKNPFFDWQFFLVLALPLGAYAAKRLAGDREVERVPGLWAHRFGPSTLKRHAAAFVGGAVLLYGARMAGGCTSGHGISGGLQLAVSSWTFFMAMFASGVATAFLLFGKEGRRHV
ncbi:MAG: YeeE/YedE family protein [Planctomycetota bacterium]|nr:YeeE/YedE family protein [Planctomycetota bacterium]